jgi:hypothetical protein
MKQKRSLDLVFAERVRLRRNRPAAVQGNERSKNGSCDLQTPAAQPTWAASTSTLP